MAPLASGRDRAFVSDLVYGTLRHLPFLDAALEPRLRAPQRLPGEIRSILQLAAYELLVRGTPRHAATHSWVEIASSRNRNLGGLVNAVLRRLEPPSTLDKATEMRLPRWLLEAFEISLGGAASAAAAGMLEAEPLWLMAFADSATKSLESDGCEVLPGPVPDVLRVRSQLPLSELWAYKNGLVQPQNPASALAAMVLAPPTGAKTYDLASGHGIKAAQLVHYGATITGIELSSRKIEAADRNLHRLGLPVEHLQHDLRRPPALPEADYLLLDAPCSGSGTLRGHPEIKMRLTPSAVANLTELQQDLLATAAHLTAPGGHLVYAVCSLIPDEGHVQIERFLEHHPGFSTEAIASPVDTVTTPVGSYVIPSGGLDGFFLSHLRRA